jgi:hypothetical protein
METDIRGASVGLHAYLVLTGSTSTASVITCTSPRGCSSVADLIEG